MKVWIAYSGVSTSGASTNKLTGIFGFGSKVRSFNFNYDTKALVYINGVYKIYDAKLGTSEDLKELVRCIFRAKHIVKR